MIEIYPSLLAADQGKLDQYIKELSPLCPGFHIDIMDHKFVPNTGISVEKANHIAKIGSPQMWVHLMVEDPESYLNQLQLLPGSIVTFHLESHKQTSKLIKDILEKKWLPGIAIKPKTGVNEVFPFLAELHQVLIMSVEPGFSGQLFLEETLAKVSPLLGFRSTSQSNFKIAMDGGIGIHNIKKVAEKGVDQAAVGSDIFDHKVSVTQAYQLLQKKSE